ncbi:MAG TPA: lipopolysaccharide kinase InaA family protein [Prolixibacteraceae bacterium]|nr:lipopolysaccharide kinase InaA family protein [Prolixibacteraceae bacterium]
MNTKIFVNSKFSLLDDFIKQIPDDFSSIGNEIYNGRNEVRRVNVQGLELTIKYFRKVTLANRYIYATFRKSKGQRAFEHSVQLLDLEVNTPEPIAYVDCYRNGKLEKSFYVSLFTNYKSLREIIAQPISESEELIKAFARFACRIHRAGVFHEDYNIDNVLYLFKENKYDFTVIDNNRMRFSDYSFGKAIRNLKRLSLPVEWIGIFTAEYARESNSSDLKTLNLIVGYRYLYLFRISIRKRMKNVARMLLGKRKKAFFVF